MCQVSLIIVAIGVCLSPVCAAGWTNVVNEAVALSGDYSKTKPWSKIDHLDGRITSLDKKLARKVQLFSCQNALGESSVSQTSPIVAFREFPRDVSNDTRDQFNAERSKKVLVNYRSFAMASNTLLYACENSFWNERPYEGRINPSLYVFVVGGKEDKVWHLPEPYAGSVRLRFAETSPCFLGFIPEKIGGFPQIAVLYGPAGSGHFGKVVVFSHHGQSDSWSSRNVLEFSGSHRFAYDEEVAIFRYEDRGNPDRKMVSFSISERLR